MAADQLPQGVYMYCDRPLGGYRSIVAMHRKIAHERIVAPCYNASRRYAMDEATFDTRFHPCKHTILTQFCYHVLRTLGRISCEAAFSYPQLVRALYGCGTDWRAHLVHTNLAADILRTCPASMNRNQNIQLECLRLTQVAVASGFPCLMSRRLLEMR
jgi:hypothetical protein